MKKKIMMLILVIPIILILTVFSVVNTSSLIVDIPVSGINLKAEKDGELYDSIYIDISNYDVNAPFYIISNIEPKNLSENLKVVRFSFNWLDEEMQDEKDSNQVVRLETKNIMFQGEEVKAYAIIPQNVGKIKITGTAGNYSDSIVVEVSSSKPTAIDSIIANNKNGEAINFEEIFSGDVLYFKANILPATLHSENTTWSSSNQFIIDINEATGKARVLSSGEVIVTATLQDSYPLGITKSVKINVKPVESVSGITIDGFENGEKTVSSVHNTFNLMVELNVKQIEENYQFIKKDNGTIDYLVLDYDQSIIESMHISLMEKTDDFRKFSILVRIKENIEDKDFMIYIRPNILDLERDPEIFSDWEWAGTKIKLVDPIDYEFNYANYSPILVKNSTNTFYLEVEPEDDGIINYRWEYENNKFTSIGVVNKSVIKLKAIGLGETNLKVTASYNFNGVDQILWTKTINLRIVEPYSSLTILENAKTFGLADEFAFGNQKIENGKYVNAYYTLDLKGYKNDVNTDVTNMQEIIWESSNPKIVSINENGTIQVIKNGLITITAYDKASYELANALNDPRKIIKTSFQIRAVIGCNIYSSDQLAKATNDKVKIIIQSDIWLGDNYVNVIDVEGKEILETKVDLKTVLGTFTTTADSTFYTNPKQNGQDSQTIPPLYYIVEFNNDVFGNGYQINAHRITTLNKHDEINAAFFGPLNLVALGEFASVKAQDNVSFLVRTPGIIIDNVELASRKDVQNLTDLNYVGTTMEIMADNVYITNSYLKNGRNVLRVYGEYKQHNSETASAPVADPTRDNPINVYLIGSILSYAREFLLKIGTNEHILGNIDGYLTTEEAFKKASPHLTNRYGTNYLKFNDPTNTDNLNDDYFVDTYVKTYMNVKDSLFNNTGIYAIGIESKFAGPSLDGLPYNSWAFKDFGWDDISGTSFAAVLNLEGEVKIHDWKNINLIDSSSLLEGGLDNTYKDLLSFDIKSLLFDLYYLANDPHIFDNMGQYQGRLNEFKEVITPYGGVNSEGKQNYFAHGGITFFGGGKNYSVIKTDKMVTESLSAHKISISEMHAIIQKAETLGYSITNSRLYSLIHYASGRESFNFLMYNSNSNFGPDDQNLAPKTVKRCKIDELNR